jgi:hypothetical protein
MEGSMEVDSGQFIARIRNLHSLLRRELEIAVAVLIETMKERCLAGYNDTPEPPRVQKSTSSSPFSGPGVMPP